ncbi:protein required for attachment to host cells [Sporomusaceae bacterium BoRhaA]|uniref:hypothetical protein n=1 Tax=Pelorhabdus rhamnosifermentans TaxID=2772457 RepID=UPI001C05FAED|nr:hypothetical protein [Pelorhabdus rhamnosifermentans]MBU2699093.1 protein required for attachment to host cells [Pelorhabdus rhamnosifermentans]
MSNDMSFIQNQIQNAALVHHVGGHGHGKIINNMSVTVWEDEKEIRVRSKPINLTMTVQINVNPDTDSDQKKQKKENSSQGQKKDEEMEEKPFGLDSLEIIGQINRTVYTLANIKNFNYR